MDLKKVQDAYPLSPMQQGMLFHCLAAPASGVYVEQLACIMNGALNAGAFERAWRRVIERHDVLRTAFVTAALKEPVQVVHRQVALPFVQEDWRGLPPAEQQARLEEFLRAERARGFNLAEPPLVRMALFRVAEDAHRFVLTHHHLLLDGWSFAALIQEVFAHYEAFAEGRELRLPPPRPYRDYIVWLRKQDQARAESFWRKTLAGVAAPTPLTVALPPKNGAESAVQYPFQALQLSEEETGALADLARRHQLTLSTVVQGAWALLLSRYSGEDDVVFGATVSGRPPDLPGAEAMIGLFINTLPVRVRIRQNAPVADWLKEIQAELAELRQYEFSPLVQIQGCSDVPRGTPLFESILVFENYPIDEALQGTGGISLEIGEMRSAESTNYALTVAVMPGRRLTIDIGCDADRFDAATIARMLGHLQTLLRGMIADPRRPIGDLPLLTGSEREQLLVEWNRTAAAFPDDKCLHQLIAERARRTPHAVAVSFEGQTLSYRDLNQRANRLAHYLRRLGVGPDVLVGLLVERSPDAIVGLLGVLKAGGAYLPLDPHYPRERLRFMLGDAAAPVLLTQKHLLDVLPDHGCCVVCLDADWERIAREPAAAPKNVANPDNLAYVIYTSGSTGRPKGVLIQHRGVVNFALACAREIGMTADDRLLQFASLSFDASVTEIFMTLLSGAATVLARREDLISIPSLLRILRNEAISIALLPPSLLKLLPADELPTVRSVISAGEACTREIVERWSPNRRFFNAYGPTETTVGPLICQIEGASQLGETVPIGRPIANTQVYLLDERRQPVPIGVPGELYIGGVGLARGYLNRPELTAERFLELRAGGGARAPRVYRTGDAARYLPDGNLEYLGRLDHQVKLRGFRIELGEIEAVLEQHPAVQQAAVLAREDQPGETRLVAYIVAAAAAIPAVEELRAFLQQKLPDYMLPAAVLRLDAMPMTPNGKVDRKALPAPDGARPQLRRELVAPRDLLESQLVLVWEEVLDVRPIGVTDNFFELGGHSLLAVRIVGQIEQRAGIALPLVTLFQHPTIEGLAGALRRQQTELPNTTVVALGAQATPPAAGRRPIFFVHPSGGSAHWYLKLAGALGADQPFYGIQAKGLNGDEDLHTRIEDMAAYYIAAMREVQPQGPYLLGSWSMGVIFVYEMARQLAARGEEVALLAIFDQGPDVPGVRPDSGPDYLMQVFGKHIPIEREQLAALAADEQVAYVLDVARRAGWVHPDMTDGQFRHFVTMLQTHTQAWWDYKAKPYPGRLTLFRAIEQSADPAPAPDWGWGRLAMGGVEIHEVPGDHIGMIDEPHVHTLALRLRACMDRAQLPLEAHAASLRNA